MSIAPTRFRCAAFSIAIAGVGLSGCSSGKTEVVMAPKTEAAEHTISVVGSARDEVIPDEACVELTLAVRDTSMPSAHAKLSEDDAALVTELKAISGLVVEESAARYEPEYETDSLGHTKLARHVASVQINVRTRDFKQIADVLGRAARLSLDRASVVYYSTEMVARKGAVRAKALDAARDKARAMAHTLDVELGEVVTIAEGDASSASQVSVNTYLDRGRVDAAPEAPPPPGAIPLSMTVSVVYRLKS
jgi:uncharacterized protein YggE